MWCHLQLSMPLLGLGLFFILPFSWALALYIIIVLASFVLYYKIMESMHASVIAGEEGLIGQIVITNARGIVHYQGEWWMTEPTLPNQSVRIVALRGLQLQVEPVANGSPSLK